MRTNLEDLKKFTKDELVMRVEKLENSNTRLTSELQEFLIETKEVNKQQEELAMRLDLLIPMKWISDNFPNVEHIFSKMVELNQEWVEEVLEGDYNLSDVLHDFKGIYAEDEHFVPRISTKVSDEKVNGYTNIQTYRLCLVLDNQHFVDNPLKTFLELLEENEFEGNDIDVINWNEVMQRYSDNILTEHTFRGILKRWE